MNMLTKLPPIAVVSMSGGKDSMATALRAIEEYGHDRVRMVHADTGNEERLVEEYVRHYVPQRLNLPLDIVRADFTKDIARKRDFVAEKWPADLMAGKPGTWTWKGDPADKPAASPAVPSDPHRRAVVGNWMWSPGRPPISADEAAEIVERTLSVLHPTGIPFLDLCLWKGRFPSRKAQFCTQELKRYPLDRYMMDLMSAGYRVESWQGVRRDESMARRHVPDREWTPEGWEIVRPIAGWSAQQTVDYVLSHGVALNPLYSMGCDRVGCMLCINAGKDEISNAAARWPEHIDRIREWERLVGMASKRGLSSLLHRDGHDGSLEDAYRLSNIDAMVDWAQTTRGGKQYDLLGWNRAPDGCSSSYGLCDRGAA